MRYASHLRLRAGAAIITSILSVAASQAASPQFTGNHDAERQSPIGYVGGRRPHVVVMFGRIKNGSSASYIKKTPIGTVTLYWRKDEGTEDGGPPLTTGEITHPDAIYHIVVISTPPLKVDFLGAYGPLGENNAKWVHLNGIRVPFRKPLGVLHLNASLNIVAIGYPDVE